MLFFIVNAIANGPSQFDWILMSQFSNFQSYAHVGGLAFSRLELFYYVKNIFRASLSTKML